ncbi:MAG: hypothetical protein EPN56_05515 [Rhodanobacter sp.]|nr:MAG: hypothetical protein EPN78_01300 [Rhodanobacter sp.]TAM15098.1 MAG: hypothetical protein EPN66_00670 [Rhodanobacter sp.]TAM36432.1 MAG: hypothetical protein EPN56_05515 [Rhodanobacter sp.]
MILQLPISRRSRHPLVRALSLLLGLAMVGLLLVFGLVVAGILTVGGAVFLLWRQWRLRHPRATVPPPHQSPANVLEGEFVVLHERH